MKYILDYTLGESTDYSPEKVEELEAFGHRYEVLEITTRGAEIIELFCKNYKNLLTNFEYRTKLI